MKLKALRSLKEEIATVGLLMDEMQKPQESGF